MAENEQEYISKCLDILKQLETEPTNLQTVGKPEWLKGNLSGCISRRITKADRCVYEVLEKKKTIKVLSNEISL